MAKFDNDYKNAQSFQKQGESALKQLKQSRSAVKTKLENVKQRIDQALKAAEGHEGDAEQNLQAHEHAMGMVENDCADVKKLEQLNKKLADAEDWKDFTNDELKDLGKIDKKKPLPEQKDQIKTYLKQSIQQLEGDDVYVKGCKDSQADFQKAVDLHKNSVDALSELAQKFSAI